MVHNLKISFHAEEVDDDDVDDDEVDDDDDEVEVDDDEIDDDEIDDDDVELLLVEDDEELSRGHTRWLSSGGSSLQ